MKAHLPCDGTGGIDSRIIQTAFPTVTIGTANSFYARNSLVMSAQATANIQVWTLPSTDFIVLGSFVRILTDISRTTGAVTPTISVSPDRTGAGAYLVSSIATLPSANFSQNIYAVASNQTTFGIQSTERLNSDGVSGPGGSEWSSGGFLGAFGTDFRGKPLAIQVTVSAGTISGTIGWGIWGILLG